MRARAAGPLVTGLLVSRRARFAASTLALVLIGLGASRAAAEDASPAPDAKAPTAAKPPTGRCVIDGEVRRDGKPAAAAVEVRWVGGFDRRMTPVDVGTTMAQRSLANVGPAAAIATVRAGADGRFRVDAMPVGWFELEATGEGGATGVATAGTTVDGLRMGVRIALVAAAGPGAAPSSIHGRVVDVEGRPFVGFARALRHGLGHYGGGARVAPLDAEGRFRFDGLAPVPWVITAFRPGEFMSSEWTSVVPSDDEVVLALRVRQPLLRGRVLSADDGSPIAGALVFSRPSGALARTDGDGRFAVLGNLGAATLDGFAPGFVYRDLVVWHSEAATPSDVVIRLRREAVVAGVVRRADDGKPVAGATVVCVGARNSFYGVIGTAVSDAEGRYAMHGVSRGEARLLVEGAGVRRAQPAPSSDARPGFDPWAFDARPGDLVMRDLEVLPGVAVEGVVRDARGSPVAGAEVSVASGGRTPDAYGVGRWLEPSVASGADGRFRIDGLVPGAEIVLAAAAPTLGKVASDVAKVPAAGPFVADLTFGASRRAEVRVVDDATGAPLADAYVRPLAPAEAARSEGGKSDLAGFAFLDGLSPGAVRVSIIPPRGYLAGDEVDLPPNVFAVTIRLRRGKTLAGVVRRADGTPVYGAYVGAQQGSKYFSSEFSTGADGSFRILGVGDGKHALGAVAADGDTAFRGSVEAEAGKSDIAIVVAPDETPRLLLRVLDADGKAVPRFDASVRLQGVDQPLGAIDAGRHLGYSFQGHSVVLVRHAREDDDTPLPLGPARVEVAAGVTEAVVRLARETRIEGRVVGADGGGIAGARVVVAYPDDEAAIRANPIDPRAIATTRTDADGGFRVGGLGTDEVAVWAEGAEGTMCDPGLRVRGGARDVLVTLVACVSPEVTVLDIRGQPLAGAVVWLERVDANAKRITGSQNGVGQVRFGPLDPRARFTLHAEPGRAGDSSPTVLRDWAPADSTVRLRGYLTMAGRVTDERGRPVADIRVSIAPAGKPSMTVLVTGADGRFSASRLLDGEYDVHASLADDDYAEPRSVRAAAGSQDVSLVLPTSGGDVVVYVDDAREGVVGTLWAKRDDGRVGWRVATSGSSGDFRFHGVPDGAACTFYAAFAKGEDFAPRRIGPQAVLVEGLRPRMERTVIPVAAGRIAGRVLGAKGRPLRVVARRGLVVVRGVVAPDPAAVGVQTFFVDGLAVGPWTVEAGVPVPAGPSTTVDTETGAEGVEITIP